MSTFKVTDCWNSPPCNVPRSNPEGKTIEALDALSAIRKYYSRRFNRDLKLLLEDCPPTATSVKLFYVAIPTPERGYYLGPKELTKQQLYGKLGLSLNFLHRCWSRLIRATLTS